MPTLTHHHLSRVFGEILLTFPRIKGKLGAHNRVPTHQNTILQKLEGVRLLKAEAEKRIEEILEEVWGKEVSGLPPIEL